MSASDIISRIPAGFEKALASGDLFFYPSTIHKHSEAGVEFEIRLCPALQKKPHLPTPHFDLVSFIDDDTEGKKGKADPFAPPYISNLLMGEIRDDDDEEYVVLLNKFAVVPEHFLLVTKDFKSQSSPLTPPDLVQTYLLLTAARNAGNPIFAFYNCGDNSGASQPHKHLQFVSTGEPDGPPIETLARSANLEAEEKPFAIDTLPYANHIIRFPRQLSSFPIGQLEQVMAESFMRLLDLVISTIRYDPEVPPGKPSYNVIVTLDHMYLIPRRQELYTLEDTGEQLSVNALGFAGMLLVKSQEELDAVTHEGVGKILRGVGLKSAHDVQTVSCSA